MGRKSRWTEAGIQDGVGEVHLLSWRYYYDFIHQQMLDHKAYIWRGQRCDNWLLESTLDRLVKRAKVARNNRWIFRQSHLEQFKFATRGRRGANPPVLDSENDWWALGQHHSLASPLLDWTTSPFVAAYFAFINNGEKQTKNRAVFALHRPSVESKVEELLAQEKAEREQTEKDVVAGKKKLGFLAALMLGNPVRPQVEFISPMSDENQRLVSQGGLFTRVPDDTDLEAWVRKSFPGEKRYILMKLFVPNQDREQCLKALNRMNINHLSLFPDLYGASKFCNLFAEIDEY